MISPSRWAAPWWVPSRSSSSCWPCCWSSRCSARSISPGASPDAAGRLPRAGGRRVRDRSLRRADAAERGGNPARHRADAERGQHQPGRLLPVLGGPRRHPLHALHDRHHGGRGRGRPRHRHRDLPRPEDGRGRSPRPAARMSLRVGSAMVALLVLALPFAAFLLLALVRPLRRSAVGAAVTSITAMVAAVASAFWLSWRAAPRALLQSPSTTWTWIPADGGPMATVGVMVDEKSMAMCMLVTFVSLMVQLYSWAYLHDEPRTSLGRYYAYHSLFAFSMLGLVLSPTFLQMFIFWELVGLCSYLLIGYWYDRPSAARAAVKAFWITKLGDLGFVAGIVMLWSATGTFDFLTLFQMGSMGTLPVEALGLTMFLIYLGAVGKSAQFPLHVWLPDAMEGPTPVFVHDQAATMVTAGVFLVTRAFPLFRLAPDVLTLIAWVGAFTALLAASMACVESDIKRVLAYSTVSQLGYMMAAGGAAAPEAGFMHLVVH